jgi:hypothetical protein
VPPAKGELAAYASGEGWNWGQAAAERIVRYMLRDLRRRRKDAEGPSAADDALQEVSAALACIEAVRDALLEKVQRAEGLFANGEPPDDKALNTWFARLYGNLRAATALAWCVDLAAKAYVSGIDPSPTPESAIKIGLAVEVVSQAFTAYRPFERTPPFNLLRLGPDIDTPACDPSLDDEVRTQAEGKLYGTRIHHFAAFGLEKWRRWDWLCGRLDAQVHLARAMTAAASDGTEKPAVKEWIKNTQRRTMRVECDISPEDFASERKKLSETNDQSLVDKLRDRPAGRKVVSDLIDAAIRVLPEDLVLAQRGAIVNALLAKDPAKRSATFWTPFARPIVRPWWLYLRAKLVRRRRGSVFALIRRWATGLWHRVSSRTRPARRQ